MKTTHSIQRVCLVVIDGWGLAPPSPSNAITLARTPHLTHILSQQNTTQSSLIAHGLNVGLPAGLMGNSEVGHLNIGAGRIVYQDIVRIDMTIEDGTLASNQTVEYIMNTDRLHLVGLVSDGGVHSHIRHLEALLRIAKERQVKQVFVHFIADGRDTAPTSALSYFEDLQAYLDDLGSGAKIATVQGRYWAMDRDKRWERTEKALDCMIDGNGTVGTVDDMHQKYAVGETDEFWTPLILDLEGIIQEGKLFYGIS